MPAAAHLHKTCIRPRPRRPASRAVQLYRRQNKAELTPALPYVAHWGRPSAYRLWEDLQDLFRRIKPDCDPTLTEVRAAWEATAAVA